jgi:agmatinase
LSKIRIVDCGDVPFDPLDIPGGVNRATEAVKAILNCGAVPVVFGGDDAVPIPVVRAYANHGPLVVVQIDEHMDWVTDRNGITEGYSSPMRRIAAMPWVKQTIQIGLHAFGAADQFKDALAAGSLLITEQEVHLRGVPAILDMIPADENYFITVDVDGFEASFMPAVSHPEPGGLTFRESVDLLGGLAARGRVVGMDWVEFVPDHDLNGLGGHAVGRLIANMLQAMLDAGRFQKC